jgi:hypothetical protein
MTPSGSTSYERIPALSGLDLGDSYVLDVVVLETSVVFAVDLVLTPEHGEYTQPRPGEQYCFRRARIEINDARSVRWVKQIMRAFRDSSGEVDYGSIDSWLLDGELTVISGDWGVLEVSGGVVSLELGESH